MNPKRFDLYAPTDAMRPGFRGGWGGQGSWGEAPLACGPPQLSARVWCPHEVAQAVELVRALRHQLHEMTRQLNWLEGQSVSSPNRRPAAVRLEVAELLQDISQAQVPIDRLQRRYLSSNGPGTRSPDRRLNS